MDSVQVFSRTSRVTVFSAKTVQIKTLVNIVRYFHHQHVYTQQPRASDPTSVLPAELERKLVIIKLDTLITVVKHEVMSSSLNEVWYGYLLIFYIGPRQASFMKYSVLPNARIQPALISISTDRRLGPKCNFYFIFGSKFSKNCLV